MNGKGLNTDWPSRPASGAWPPGSDWARQAAHFLDSLATVSERHRATAQQQAWLRQNGVDAAQIIRWHLEYLEDRMRAASNRCCLRVLLKVLENKPLAERLWKTAYFRDLILILGLETAEFDARWREDEKEVARIRELIDFWDRADKGHLARNSRGRAALTFLRQLYVCKAAPTDAERATAEAELSKRLLDATKNPECDFELALAKAKQFRANRRPARLTEEGDLRADLAYFSVLTRMRGEDFPDADTLMEMFAPHLRTTLMAFRKKGEIEKARNIKRNFRKLLDEMLVTPRRQKRSGGTAII